MLVVVQYLPSAWRPHTVLGLEHRDIQRIPPWLPFDPCRSNGDSLPLPLHGKGIKGEDRHPARICYSDETCHKRYKELHTVHGSCHLIHPELPTPIWHLEVIPNALIAWRIALPFFAVSAHEMSSHMSSGTKLHLDIFPRALCGVLIQISGQSFFISCW